MEQAPVRETTVRSAGEDQVETDFWKPADFPADPASVLQDIPLSLPRYRQFLNSLKGRPVEPQRFSVEELHGKGYRDWKDYVFQGRLLNWD